MECPYNVLGVKKDVSKEELKVVYHKLADIYHPDKTSGNQELFVKIKEAYDFLMDDERRRLYDELGFNNKESVEYTAVLQLKQMFMNLLSMKNPIREEQMMQFMVNSINEDISQRRKLMFDTKLEIDKINRISRRLKYKGNKEDFLHLAIIEKVKEHEKLIADLKLTLDVEHCMIDLIQNYEIEDLKLLMSNNDGSGPKNGLVASAMEGLLRAARGL